MKTLSRFSGIFFEEQGAVAVIVAILATVLIGFAVFAVDIPNLIVAKNELQNAADAGALAGAHVLYSDDGQMVNAGANAFASETVIANLSQRAAVEVESVERGHWSFASQAFTPNDSLEPVSLWDATAEELDANTDFINAVRVRVQRSATQVPSFFARIFGRDGFTADAEAIAYLGFAGTLEPWAYDQPIAICLQSILENGVYSCNIGRMLNSGSDASTSNTAGWTNFTQPCGTASSSTVRPLICRPGGANENPVSFGAGIGATGGTVSNVLADLHNCWLDGQNIPDDDDGEAVPIDTDGDGIPDQPWKMRLPVVDCPGNNVSNCAEVRGAVEVQVVWIQPQQIPDSKLDNPDPAVAPCDTIPCSMGEWENNSPVARERWEDFVSFFELQDATGNPPDPTNKAIYFKPDCTAHERAGTTGGDNFGILAEIPVLVD